MAEIKESGTLVPVAPGFWMAPLKSGRSGDMRFTVVPCEGVFMIREGLSYRVLKNISNNK